MSRRDHVLNIRAACVNANPEKNWVAEYEHDEVPVRLADILRALKAKDSNFTPGHFARQYALLVARWVDGIDDLEAQPDERVAYIHKLLFS